MNVGRIITIPAGKKARIPVVDDSVVIRRLVTTALETKRRILSEMHGSLAPGGYLLLGGAETTLRG